MKLHAAHFCICSWTPSKTCDFDIMKLQLVKVQKMKNLRKRTDPFPLQVGMPSKVQAAQRSCKKQTCFEGSGTAYQQSLTAMLAPENSAAGKESKTQF